MNTNNLTSTQLQITLYSGLNRKASKPGFEHYRIVAMLETIAKAPGGRWD